MFATLNKTFSNLLDNSDRTETMSQATDPNHKCNENNCAPTRYSGCNILCSRCMIPKFIDCVSDRTEITELMKAIQIAPDPTTSQQLIHANVKKITTLFGSESILQLVCPACIEGVHFLISKPKMTMQ